MEAGEGKGADDDEGDGPIQVMKMMASMVVICREQWRLETFCEIFAVSSLPPDDCSCLLYIELALVFM